MTILVKPLPKRSRRPNDKIFDNKFNRGEIDFQPFEKNVEIDKQYVNDQMLNYYNSYDYYRIEELTKVIGTIYEGTKWWATYHSKRIPKFELSEIYQYIRSRIEDTTYTESEVFVEIADFLDVRYITLYEMVSNVYKKKILEELNENFNIQSKLKTYKLF